MPFPGDAATARSDGLTVAYIGGGSANWARVFINDVCREPRLGGTVRLHDTDPGAARLNAAVGARYAALPEVGGRWSFTVRDQLEAALEGADVVVLSILPGDFAAMACDIATPARFGIRQAVGDTVGPGGVVRALRAIPIYEGFARAIRARCPAAWVINFTNPMSVLVRTLYRVFPEIRAWGCCHEVAHVRALLARLLAEHLGDPSVRADEIAIDVAGVNHFTWITRAVGRGVDVAALWRAKAADAATRGWPEGGRDADDPRSRYFDSLNRVKFHLSRHFGAIAAAGDRHLAEFLPQSWYLRDAESWGFGLTPVDYRVADRERRRAEARAIADGRQPATLGESGESFTRQLCALYGHGDAKETVNLPNLGQMAGLPEGAVVETGACFSATGTHPIVAGALPRELEDRVLAHALNHEGLVEAVLRRDREHAFRVFMGDPALAELPPDAGRRLFDAMTADTAAWLPAELRGPDATGRG